MISSIFVHLSKPLLGRLVLTQFYLKKGDIFVLVVGGRYGSRASGESDTMLQRKLEEYDSITRREFDAAYGADIPIYILIEGAVASEYQTYVKNRNSENIQYAHVDSVNVFKFIDNIYSKKRNNAVCQFSDASDIESWLREQWAGSFRELLRSKSQQKQLTVLSEQLGELKAVNTTLKNYLEEVIKGVKPDNYESFIKTEAEKLIRAKLIEKIKATPYFDYLISSFRMKSGESPHLSDEDIYDIATVPETADELIAMLKARVTIDDQGEKRGITVLREFKEAQRDYNKARRLSEKKRIDFSKCSDSEISETARPSLFSDDVELEADAMQ